MSLEFFIYRSEILRIVVHKHLLEVSRLFRQFDPLLSF
jgi:hypothetical protein